LILLDDLKKKKKKVVYPNKDEKEMDKKED
jgi:hypothetical protein